MALRSNITRPVHELRRVAAAANQAAKQHDSNRVHQGAMAAKGRGVRK